MTLGVSAHCSGEPRLAAASFLADTRGSTAIDYALIASVVAGVIAGAVFTLGGNVFDLFQSVGTVWPS